MTHKPWKGPSTIPNTGISTVTTEGRSQALDKSVDKLPPVMAGMDRAEALAFVSRLYDSAQADLHLREIDPSFAQDWVSQLREEVDAGLMKPRTFNRRVAAISSLYRWASDPSRSAVSGVPRNPIPSRS